MAHHGTPHTPRHTTWSCTPCCGIHFSQISLQSHVTTHLSQSEGSILSNLSDLVRNHEISPKFFPPFKEQSCYNSSAKKLGDPVCHSRKDVIIAAMCTSPPHDWEHQDRGIEPLTVATPTIDASDPTDESEINTDIVQIYQVATDVLSTLGADLQDYGITKQLTLGKGVFPVPTIEQVEDVANKSKTESVTPTSSPLSSIDKKLGKYYEILNPEDDVMYISHADILATKCTVCAKLLTEEDIALWSNPKKLLSPRPRPGYKNLDNSPEKDISSSSEDIRVKTLRPGRKPSLSRMRSQAYIKKKKTAL